MNEDILTDISWLARGGPKNSVGAFVKSKISILTQRLALPAVVFFGALAGPAAALLVIDAAVHVLALCGGATC